MSGVSPNVLPIFTFFSPCFVSLTLYLLYHNYLYASIGLTTNLKNSSKLPLTIRNGPWCVLTVEQMGKYLETPSRPKTEGSGDTTEAITGGV